MTNQNKFIFDLKLRDKLLFEDADFTSSRRYFWAYNTLVLINDSMGSMINAYKATFTAEFWGGKHPILWPQPAPTAPESARQEWQRAQEQMVQVRSELEWSIDDLRGLVKSNLQLQHKIESFREQLYSGSSVKENRTAIEQGENIKVLTGVSMLFLPLTFVTVSSPTDLPTSKLDWSDLTVRMVGIVRVWHGTVPNFTERLAVRRHHGRRLRALLRPDIYAANSCRDDSAETAAPLSYQSRGRVEELVAQPAGEAVAESARSDGAKEIDCGAGCIQRPARKCLESDRGQK